MNHQYFNYTFMYGKLSFKIFYIYPFTHFLLQSFWLALKSQVNRTLPSAFLGLLTSRLFSLTSNDLGLTLDGVPLVVVVVLVVVVAGFLGLVVTGILRVVGILVVTLNTGACLMVVGVCVFLDVVVVGGALVVGVGNWGRELFDDTSLSPDTETIQNHM